MEDLISIFANQYSKQNKIFEKVFEFYNITFNALKMKKDNYM